MKGTLHKTDKTFVVRYQNPNPKFIRAVYLHPEDIKKFDGLEIIDPNDYGIEISFELVSDETGNTYARLKNTLYAPTIEEYVDEQIALGNIEPHEKTWLTSVCMYWRFRNG